MVTAVHCLSPNECINAAYDDQGRVLYLQTPESRFACHTQANYPSTINQKPPLFIQSLPSKTLIPSIFRYYLKITFVLAFLIRLRSLDHMPLKLMCNSSHNQILAFDIQSASRTLRKELLTS
jgi:hypothetical protein